MCRALFTYPAEKLHPWELNIINESNFTEARTTGAPDPSSRSISATTSREKKNSDKSTAPHQRESNPLSSRPVARTTLGALPVLVLTHRSPPKYPQPENPVWSQRMIYRSLGNDATPSRENHSHSHEASQYTSESDVSEHERKTHEELFTAPRGVEPSLSSRPVARTTSGALPVLVLTPCSPPKYCHPANPLCSQPTNYRSLVNHSH
ncbi:hypothetical protein B0H11DRAFT_1916342 [Mycena galericulata]|nr:hypothetical protein B0H11DRAFT_1916342 [Mycena galericulata]